MESVFWFLFSLGPSNFTKKNVFPKVKPTDQTALGKSRCSRKLLSLCIRKFLEKVPAQERIFIIIASV